ncbi:MAG: phage tail assembly protein [Oscillochloris sp.]|nr:phage tail assembly protein [Oscillochloris sp.]
MLQTEFIFTLPCGYVDAQGNLHREGVMRRATALDEVELLDHPRVRANEAYLSILLLSRVIIRLGTIAPVTPAHIGALFATDFMYLQDMYLRVNSNESSLIETRCPSCGTHFMLDLNNDHGSL